MRILLKDITAITLAGADGGILEDISIVIDSGKIVKMGQDLDELPLGDYDRVIDGEGKVVIPGLVNAHTHAAMVLFRGCADDLPLGRWLEEGIWPAERKLTGEDVYWASLLAAIEMIRSGTTTFADMYFFMDEVAQAVEESGMRALLARGIIAPKFDSKAEEELDKAIELVESWEGGAGGRIRTAFAPHSLYSCSEELLKRTVELAKGYDVMLHTHLAETRGEVEQIRRAKGMSPVQFMDRLGLLEVPILAAHCVHLSEEEIKALADKAVNVNAVHCPQSNMKLGSGIAPVPTLLEVGVNVALGTDGAASNNNLDMLEEIRFAGYLQRALDEKIPAIELLKMATCYGAKALGLEKEVGTIEEGKRADLAVLNLDRVYPLRSRNLVDAVVRSARPQDIEAVIIDGRIVMEKGRVSTIDEEEVKAKVRELSKKYRECN